MVLKEFARVLKGVNTLIYQLLIPNKLVQTKTLSQNVDKNVFLLGINTLLRNDICMRLLQCILRVYAINYGCELII